MTFRSNFASSIYGLEFANGLGNKLDLAAGKFRIHRQRENLLGVRLRYGKISAFVAQILICRLQMNRNRIMDACVDAFADEVVFQLVALLRANDVKMPHGFGATGFARHDDSTALQVLLIK